MYKLLICIFLSLSAGSDLFAENKNECRRDSIGGFWGNILDINTNNTTPEIVRNIYSKGDVKSFKDASRQLETQQTADASEGYPFNDVNVYKTIELLSHQIADAADPKKERQLSELVDIVLAAQESDGYLYTYRTKNPQQPHPWAGASRWVNEKFRSYESYNFSKLTDAATAYYQATGKRDLLDAAVRFAENICNTIGDFKGGIKAVPGMQGAEAALIKLYEQTRNKKFLNQAVYFLKERHDTLPHNKYNLYRELKLRQQWEKMFGLKDMPDDIWNHIDSQGEWINIPAQMIYGNKCLRYTDTSISAYMKFMQQDKPVKDMNEASGQVGHAINLYRGMTAVAKHTKDSLYNRNIKNIWYDIIAGKMSILGGVGSDNSTFGKGYEPYNNIIHETDAQISFMKWNLQLFDLYKDSKYIDVFERTLYNVFLAAVSLDGKSFNVYNRQESFGENNRKEWFSHATAPAEAAAFISSLKDYIYYTDKDELYVNLFIDGHIKKESKGLDVEIQQETRYPWDGNVKIKILSKGDFTLKIRIPGWARDEATPGKRYGYIQNEELPFSLSVNGKAAPPVLNGGYIDINRKWQGNDSIILKLTMNPRLVEDKGLNLKSNGFVSIEKGPLVYCAESADNKDVGILNILLNQKPILKSEVLKKFSDSISDINIIKTNVQELSFDPSGNLITKPFQLTFIPYFMWGNREKGIMSLWNPLQLSAATPKPIPSISSTSKVTGNVIIGLSALNDNIKPIIGKSLRVPYCRWTQGSKSTAEWIAYEFKNLETISKATVYWHDDQPWGDCALPVSWKLSYLTDKNKWVPVKNSTPYPILKSLPSTVRFNTVKAKGIKLEIVPQKERFSGIYEFSVE